MLLVAPDSFKGSLPAADVAAALARGARSADGTLETRTLPLADGGEGTLDVIRRVVGGETVELSASDPWGRRLRAVFLRVEHSLLGLPAPVAVVEWAETGGFVEGAGAAEALEADSGGVGQVLRTALDRGCRSFVLGLGGSATTDGAAGLLRELGASLLDAGGEPIPRGGRGLGTVATADLSGLRRVPSVALSDVTAPLLGSSGTVARFAPQKGADRDACAQLDLGLHRWCSRLDPGREHSSQPGAGAAGGAGFGLAATIGTRLLPGAPTVADLCGLDQHLTDATRVWTGEGRLDRTTLAGKVVAEVARRARVPVELIGGDLGPGADGLDALHPSRIVTLVDPPSQPDPPASWCSLGLALDRTDALASPAAGLEAVGRAMTLRGP